jgi:hypothetical protein
MATRSDPVPGRVFDLLVLLRGLALLAVLLQWLILLALSLFPFGLALVPRGTSASGLFSGAFLRDWSALPAGPGSVIRVVYAHGLIAAAFAWLMLCVQVTLLWAPWSAARSATLGPALYELPAVFLMAGIAVCEAVGDRRRGLLAVGALAGFQVGVPLASALLPEVLGSAVPFARNGMPVAIAGYAVGLAGALPPLVHLRGRLAPSSERA